MTTNPMADQSADPGAKERAQEAAGTAKEEGRHVAGVAKDEARTVANEAAAQARGVLDDALNQVSSQSREQKDRLAGTLHSLGDDLDSMASQGSPGLATDLARQVSGYARTLSSQLESKEPGELLDDVRRFARQRPGTFLMGALAAGVVVGRLARGAADGIAAAQAENTGMTTGTTTGMGAGITGTTGTSTTGLGGTTAPSGPTYTPMPGAEPSSPHGQPTGIPSAPSTPPSPPSMSTPEAGYGQRGASSSEDFR